MRRDYIAGHVIMESVGPRRTNARLCRKMEDYVTSSQSALIHFLSLDRGVDMLRGYGKIDMAA